MLRVNTGIKPNAAGACVFGAPAAGPSRLGAIDGDLCGFPNGRRLLDDVTDIEVRAIMEGYGPIRQRGPRSPEQDAEQRARRRRRRQRRRLPDELPVHRDAAAGLLPHARPSRHRRSVTVIVAINGPGSARAV